MAEESARARKVRSFLDEQELTLTLRDSDALRDIRVENCIGFSQVPVGLARPLRLVGPDNIDNLFMDTIFAPLTTYEPTLVASCSRRCKAFNASGGLNFELLGNGMSRAPVFVFDHPEYAVAFARAISAFQSRSVEWAESTSEHVQLRSIKPTVIRSQVHLFCTYHCGSATGQNMLLSDTKPSWGNVKVSRGVEVIVWGTITKQTCQSVLGCSTFRSNTNTANILAAMFTATGQDVGSVAEVSWSHLTSELDSETKDVRMTLYFPSLPVGTVGGGTGYATQQEALKLVKCVAPDMKGRLAGIIA
ncbi:putative hmg-CoA reductase [Diaporthe sp. PMI_573]|nr:putative hmg-CoA reductase [Diaporthaceae sp. PMI_573]